MKDRSQTRPALLLVIALAAIGAGLYFTIGADVLPTLLGAGPTHLLLASGMVAVNADQLSELTQLAKTRFGEMDERLSRLDAEVGGLLKRANRPGFGPSGDTELDAGQRKSLDMAARALLAGDQAAAMTHFREAKAMSVGNDPSGGYLVMPAVSDQMTKVMLELSPLLNAIRIVDLEEGDEFEEIIDAEDSGVTWAGELQDRPETDAPELGKFSVPLHELYAQPAVSQKLIDTSSIDVMQWLQDKLAEKFASAFNSVIVSGNGVAKPRGFLSVPASSSADSTRAWGALQYLATGTSGALSSSAPFDIFDDTIAALKPQYRKEASWLMNRTTAAVIRKLKTSTGERLWQPQIAAGQPPTLMGYPVIEDDFMPAIGANTMSVAFGHFRKGYILVRRLGLRFLVDPYTAKPKVRLYTYQRVGGGIANSEAIKLVKFGTS